MYSKRCKICEGEDVRETFRAVSVLCKEHRDAVRLDHTTKSAVAEHAHCQMCEIDWKNVEVTDHAKSRQERKVREALQIKKRKPQINRDKVMGISDT